MIAASRVAAMSSLSSPAAPGPVVRPALGLHHRSRRRPGSRDLHGQQQPADPGRLPQHPAHPGPVRRGPAAAAALGGASEAAAARACTPLLTAIIGALAVGRGRLAVGRRRQPPRPADDRTADHLRPVQRVLHAADRRSRPCSAPWSPTATSAPRAWTSVEAYVLMLMAGTGAMLMAASGGLIMLFLGLEIMSIALYVMAAFHRRRVQSGEAGLQILHPGLVLVRHLPVRDRAGLRVAPGRPSSSRSRRSWPATASPTTASCSPAWGCSSWVSGSRWRPCRSTSGRPDVYQGSPTPFTGYMAAVAKAAGFAGLLRVLVGALPSQQANWRPIIWVLAVLTLLVGSVLAIWPRRTSSGCSPTRRSARPATSSSASRRHRTRAPRAPCSTFSPTPSSSSGASPWSV